jgi:hypothetical protein
MLFIFEMFKKHRQSVVVETPPALLVVEPKIPEQQLRAMYRIGFTAGLKQAQDEQEQAHRAEIASLKTLKQKPAQPVPPLPVQQAQEPQQMPISIHRRAGGWMHAENARRRVAAKIGQHILPVRPKFNNVPTEAELPAIRHFPDAG